MFRLGIDDAQLVSRELGVFTAEEVLNLDVGQAFVRSGASAKTFNLETHPKPDSLQVDPTPRIHAFTRDRSAHPVADVEAEMGNVIPAEQVESTNAECFHTEPEDPSEDDLVT